MIFSPVIFIFFICGLAELHRTPYDFSEGESELVSGFNTEYMSYGFTVIFLNEYLNCLLFRIVVGLTCIFLTKYTFGIISFFVRLFILFTRLRLPRCRYDFLMDMM